MKTVRAGMIALVFLTLLTGGIYPAVVTVFAQLVFPWQANGSMIADADSRSSIIRHPSSAFLGSQLIAQGFSDPRFFWPRPSATGPTPYNSAASSGSNLGPTNPALATAIQERIAALLAADPDNRAPIPADLVTASASGLDPHLSPAAAEYQVGRVARARGLTVDSVQVLVQRFTTGRQFFVLGEPVVNVLRLNLALEGHTLTP